MTFDSQLSWAKHITEVVRRCKKDLNLMRYLSGTKFGADKLTLLAKYKTLIRSKIEYGCQAYASAPKTQLLKLDRIQSAALRIVTGAYKSTANTDIQIECSVQSLSLRREELMLKYWARSWPINQQLPLNSLYDLSLYETTKDRLKRKIPFVMKVRELVDKYQLKDIEIQEPVYPDRFALRSIKPREILKSTVNKKTDSIQSVEGKTKLHIQTSYKSFLQIYTDGSKDMSKDQVGGAFAIPDYQPCRTFKFNDKASIFSAELTAIIEALKWIRANKPENVVILTDSLSSMGEGKLRAASPRVCEYASLRVCELYDCIVRVTCMIWRSDREN